MGSHRFELLRRDEDLAAVAADWDALYARSRAGYYLSFASCWESWKTIHQPMGRKLACAVLYENETLVAVLPMVCFRRGLWRIAQTLGPEAAEGCDILVADGAPAALATDILKRFVASARPDALDLPYVANDSALAAAIHRSGRYHVVSQVADMPCALLRGETDWAGFEKSLSRSYQQQSRRKLRRLEEQGEVVFEVLESGAGPSIDWLLDQKRLWGEKVDKRGPWLFSNAYRTYLKALADSGDRILTFVLKLDGVPIAVKVIAVGPGLCSLIIAAYEENHSYYSPGSLLDDVWVKHVFDNFRDADGRPLDINFGVGLERYKTHWSRGHAYETKTFKVTTSTWGEVPYRLKTAVRGLKRRLSTAGASAA